MKHRILWFAIGLSLPFLYLVTAQVIAQNDSGAYLRIWRTDGSIEEYRCLPVNLDATPTQENFSTPTSIPIPTVTSTPMYRCYGHPLVDNLNARSVPWGNIITTYDKTDRLGIMNYIYDTKNPKTVWYQVSSNPSLYVYAPLIKLDGTCTWE